MRAGVPVFPRMGGRGQDAGGQGAGRAAPPRRAGPAWLLLAGFTAMSVPVFAQSRYPLLFLLLPPLMWVASRLGTRGVLWAALLLEAVTLAATAAGKGPFTLVPHASFAETLLVAQLFVAVTAGMGWATARLLERHGAALAELRSASALSGLLADNACDVIVHLGPDRSRIYVSPASLAVLGYTPEELARRRPVEDIHPEDWARISASIETLQQVEGRTRDIYRFRHRQGHWIWLETYARILPDGQGSVSVIRDVSDRKAMELELEEANRLLAEQAMQDGLTGLANRRCFDAALGREWRRAAREEVPLSLLLLDVDHFKAFNDRFGHQSGDDCLRDVAGAVQHAIRRPGDLAARYGGEEFAVLLPATDAAGAAQLAERVRAAVAALGVPHSGSPFGSLTATVGAATAMPWDGSMSEGLLAAADAALYQAKRAGRNQVSCAPATAPAPVVLLPGATPVA